MNAKAQLYVDAYKHYTSVTKQQEELEVDRQKAHTLLCKAASLFLDLDEDEMNKILFLFESIEKDAKAVLGIED